MSSNASASTSDPKSKLYKPPNPSKIRKYNDKLDTYLTSRFLISTPCYSISLNLCVTGKGTFANINPEKKWLTQAN